MPKNLTFQEENKSVDNYLCSNCQEKDFHFNKYFTLFSYEEPIKKLILDLKFKEKLLYGKFLGKILASTAINSWYQYKCLPELIIPVPLHIDRLRSRGFNQAFELIKYMMKTSKINVSNSYCTRTKNTINQISLIKENRNTNIKHAFMAKKIPYKHIAILDDVVTTGNTVKSLCKAIVKKNPTIIIDIWSICRA